MKSYETVEPHEFVDEVLAQALADGASDIYWLPAKDKVTVRAKVAGQKLLLATVPREYGERCITRIKVLGKLLTYRTEIAQDGAIRAGGERPDAELRVASMPTSYGERITIRVLQESGAQRRISDLGFVPTVEQTLLDLLRKQHGLLVLTGPTGSGKTTTIYALIRELLAQGEDPASIITIEDPIECEIEDVSQVQIARSNAEWGYAAALRAALRHDVKTLVIGEMRDKDVVRVVLDAALTGHRVVTTYHAGEIPAVYARLLHQGFEPFLVAAAVSGVLTQRLAQRKDGSGAVPVAAVLRADDDWREFIIANPGLGELRKQMKTIPNADLATAAAALAAAGTIHEKDVYLL